MIRSVSLCVSEPCCHSAIVHVIHEYVYCFYRKMMNRVAAQNARDRKKVYVEDLEKKVAMLENKVGWFSVSSSFCL